MYPVWLVCTWTWVVICVGSRRASTTWTANEANGKRRLVHSVSCCRPWSQELPTGHVDASSFARIRRARRMGWNRRRAPERQDSRWSSGFSRQAGLLWHDISVGPLRAPGAASESRSSKVLTYMLIVISLFALFGSALLARRNLRLGRGDRRGQCDWQSCFSLWECSTGLLRRITTASQI
jgi:hypothetical protein